MVYVKKAKPPAPKDENSPFPTDIPPVTRRAKVSVSAWWCPWDDRAMQHKDPCDECGAILNVRAKTATQPE